MNKNQLQRRKRRKEEKERKGKKMMKKKISQFYKIENFVVEQTESQSLGTQGKKERERECGYVEEKICSSLFSFSVQIVHTQISFSAVCIHH